LRIAWSKHRANRNLCSGKSWGFAKMCRQIPEDASKGVNRSFCPSFPDRPSPFFRLSKISKSRKLLKYQGPLLVRVTPGKLGGNRLPGGGPEGTASPASFQPQRVEGNPPLALGVALAPSTVVVVCHWPSLAPKNPKGTSAPNAPAPDWTWHITWRFAKKSGLASPGENFGLLPNLRM